MIVVVNFSDAKFEKYRKFNSISAKLIGQADKVIEFNPSMIDDEFLNRNKAIFSHSRGFGLWLWKPYIVLKALEELKEGDYLMYCDAGAIFVNRINYLVKEMERSNQSIMLFELPLKEVQFTKSETFHLMAYKDYSQNQILGGYFLLKKNPQTVSFIKEWLNSACDERILSPNKFIKEIEEFDTFISHREDQSVLSILAHKRKLTVFRDPSNFGKKPWQYLSKGVIYSPKKYLNSNYPTIISSNRTSHPILYLLKNNIKSILKLIGIDEERRKLNSIYK